jgi:hypothetical protein
MSGILAQFETLGATRQAIERLRAEGHSELDVFSPIPAPELEEALGIVASPVGRWALIGGATGFLTAVALTGLTALAYPLVTASHAQTRASVGQLQADLLGGPVRSVRAGSGRK